MCKRYIVLPASYLSKEHNIINQQKQNFILNFGAISVLILRLYLSVSKDLIDWTS